VPAAGFRETVAAGRPAPVAAVVVTKEVDFEKQMTEQTASCCSFAPEIAIASASAIHFAPEIAIASFAFGHGRRHFENFENHRHDSHSSRGQLGQRCSICHRELRLYPNQNPLTAGCPFERLDDRQSALGEGLQMESWFCEGPWVATGDFPDFFLFFDA
jgi:hypothetical protein